MSVARDECRAVLRVERAEFVLTDAAQFLDSLHPYVARDLYRVRPHRQFRVDGADVVVAIVVHDVVGSNECRDIAACLGREIGVDGPVVFHASCPLDGFVDVVRAAVVACNDERPVAEDAVEVVQIACGGVARLDGIAPFVNEACHLEAVLFARTYHELPQTHCACTADSHGVECALDDGQVLQLQWYLVAFECFFEDRIVEVSQSEQYGYGVAEAAAVEIDVLLHDVVIRHVDDIGQAAEPIGVGLWVELRVLAGCLAAFVEEEEVACLPVEQ